MRRRLRGATGKNRSTPPKRAPGQSKVIESGQSHGQEPGLAETAPTTIRTAEGLALWLGDRNESLPVDEADQGPQESIAEWMAGFPADEMSDAEIVGI